MQQQEVMLTQDLLCFSGGGSPGGRQLPAQPRARERPQEDSSALLLSAGRHALL